jgi:3-(3-hydroxy-phenyl)propionate hydroxylase
VGGLGPHVRGAGLKDDYAVIVVGAGPTGLTLANLLGAYGVDTLLVERNAATVTEPRAVSIDDESLRTMQCAGLAEVVLSTLVPGYGSRYYTPSRRVFLRVEPLGQPYGFPRRNAFRQPTLEGQLRAGLARYDSVTARFSWKFLGLEQTAEKVRVRLEAGEGGAIQELECDYLVGCDGASSTVRGAIDVGLGGKTFAERWLIVDLENSPAPSRHTEVFCDSRRPCIALPGPGLTRRYEFKLHARESGEEMLRPEVVARLLAEHGAAAESRLVRKVVYSFHARIVRKWRVGRVLLAGDAAHLTPPFAGQGMNSGIRDAHNLAWKLAAVAKGQLGPRLLATYELERRDHVWKMIQLALTMGRIMAPSNRLSGWLVQSGFRLLAVWPKARDYFGQMKYKPQPRFRRGFLLAGPILRRDPLVGRLLEQPAVTRADGKRVLLDEVLGPRFALLGRAADADRLRVLASQRACQVLKPLLVTVGRPGEAPPAVGGLEHVVDHTGRLLVCLNAYDDQALLVRPDHYVAAALELRQPEAAAARLQRLLGELWPDGSTAVEGDGASQQSLAAKRRGQSAGSA